VSQPDKTFAKRVPHCGHGTPTIACRECREREGWLFRSEQAAALSVEFPNKGNAVKVSIEWDEWYPVYALADEPLDGFDVDVEFDEATVERIKAAFVEFNEVQTILRNAVDEVRGVKR
jgi:hypothetical protein